MTRKKNKFLTVVFSFIPGAGQMFMGFMKLGTSFMLIFSFIILLSAWLNLGPLAIMLPVIWFYSFFDSINKCFASNEDFEVLKDHYLFTDVELANLNNISKNKLHLLFGILLLIIGCYSIWNIILNDIIPRFNLYVYNSIINIAGSFPKLILAAAIIFAGIWLIRGKKKELDKDA